MTLLRVLKKLDNLVKLVTDQATKIENLQNDVTIIKDWYDDQIALSKQGFMTAGNQVIFSNRS